MILLPSPNYEDRPPHQTVDMLVLHYTGMESGDAALERLRDPEAKVSAHWLVDEDGTVYHLVGESYRAWHAGLASWRGQRDVNGRSVGVELVNPGHEFGYRPFPEAQMQALESLCLGILGRHPIPPRNVVGHSDVAPLRKTDPGELFDWPRLAARGVGLWPGDSGPADADPDQVVPMLESFGYDVGEPQAAITAFQRHFRPDRVDGEPDAETAGRLAALLQQVA